VTRAPPPPPRPVNLRLPLSVRARLNGSNGPRCRWSHSVKYPVKSLIVFRALHRYGPVKYVEMHAGNCSAIVRYGAPKARRPPLAAPPSRARPPSLATDPARLNRFTFSQRLTAPRTPQAATKAVEECEEERGTPAIDGRAPTVPPSRRV
jgi:hypothetical protein